MSILGPYRETVDEPDLVVAAPVTAPAQQPAELPEWLNPNRYLTPDREPVAVPVGQPAKAAPGRLAI